MPYTPAPFATIASITAGTKFSQYPTELNKMMSDIGSYLEAELSPAVDEATFQAGVAALEADNAAASAASAAASASALALHELNTTFQIHII